MTTANIIRLRHGQSWGNVDPKAYKALGDHNVPLTEEGAKQALRAGELIKDFAEVNGIDKFRVYYSPFKRTVQTKDGVIIGLTETFIEKAYEDERLREQDFGIFSDIVDDAEKRRLFPAEFEKYDVLRKSKGKVYARPPMGESRLDVALRVRDFTGSLMRDYDRGHRNFIVISHGVTDRAFEMSFLHRGVEWFENSVNPNNCEIRRIYGSYEGGWQHEVLDIGHKEPKIA